jgi:thiol-disulfide isomerase/thioredoxin
LEEEVSLMSVLSAKLRLLGLALLYMGAVAGANPALAEALPRAGDMRKLVVHDTPREGSEVGFTDASGVPLSLADFAGRVVVLNFWATWCPPCRAEMPTLNALQRDMGGDDLVVLAVATGRNMLPAIEKFNADAGIDALPVYLDPKGQIGPLARSFGVAGLPVTVLLDREGREIGRLTGEADWNSDAARALLAAVIAR